MFMVPCVGKVVRYVAEKFRQECLGVAGISASYAPTPAFQP
jgi:hypothetical protein